MSQIALWLGKVCQLAVVSAEAGEPSRFGCACCAPFAECAPGTAVGSVEAVFAPSASVAGAFTGPGKDELALTMPGCESHAENWGGLLLLERGPQGFALVRYVSSLNAQACWALRRADGRDLLLCQRGDAHQGTADERLFLWDLSGSDEQLQASEEVFSVIDNEWSGCWSELGTEISSILLEPPELHSNAGQLELSLRLDARRGRVTAPYLARCRAIENEDDPVAAQKLPRPRSLLGYRKERVLLRFDGQQSLTPHR
jgi:hypothetical protein